MQCWQVDFLCYASLEAIPQLAAQTTPAVWLLEQSKLALANTVSSKSASKPLGAAHTCNPAISETEAGGSLRV